MNNLKEFLTIDSREIAEIMEIPHCYILKKLCGIKSKSGLTKREGIIDVFNQEKIPLAKYFIKSNYKDAKGEDRRCYLCTRLGCDFLANKFNGKKGIVFTAEYVKRFYEMERDLIKNQYSYMVEDPIKRAKLWIVEEEERNMLRTQNKINEPKVIFAEAVSSSKTSILIGEFAKILKQNGINTGCVRLFNYLRENGYLIKRKGSDYNMPTQKAMDLKLFQIKETIITHYNGEKSITRTTKITGKGQVYFLNKFLYKKVAEYDDCKM